MESQWWMVIVSWGLLLGIMLVLTIREWRKSPEQKQAERERTHAKRLANRQKTAEQPPAPSEGGLHTVLRTLLMCAAAMIALLVTILILVID